MMKEKGKKHKMGRGRRYVLIRTWIYSFSDSLQMLSMLCNPIYKHEGSEDWKGLMRLPLAPNSVLEAKAAIPKEINC